MFTLECECVDILAGNADACICHPPSPEERDGMDNDCDKQVDEGYPETDQDGLADCVDPDDDNDGAADGEDCAPLDAAIYPGAAELCDGLDDDCNGEVDEGCQ